MNQNSCPSRVGRSWRLVGVAVCGILWMVFGDSNLPAQVPTTRQADDPLVLEAPPAVVMDGPWDDQGWQYDAEVVRPASPIEKQALAAFSMIRQDAIAAAPIGEPVAYDPGAAGVDPSIAATMAELRRPMAGIRIEANYVREEVPLDLAAKVMGDEESVFVSGGNSAAPPPNRYPAPFFHQPLYFEELNLERCGKGCGILQNAVSSARLISGTLVFPYRWSTQHPCELVRARGDCQTCQSYATPLEPLQRGPGGWLKCKGLTVETATLAGFSFLLL